MADVSWINTKELQDRQNFDGDAEKINWFSPAPEKPKPKERKAIIPPKPLSGEVIPPKPLSGEVDGTLRYQQSDLLKPLLYDIAINGLPQAYQDFIGGFTFPPVVPADPVTGDDITPTANPKDVIIIGAGVAGMSAAFELKRAGHNVKILEMTQRTGGRVKTFDEVDGFDKGLHADGGAMRLPGTKAETEDENQTWERHFMTNFYAKRFAIPIVPFKNSDDNALYKFYNNSPIAIKDFTQDNFDDNWRGWDKRFKFKDSIPDEDKPTTINEYYVKTAGLVELILRTRLDGVTSIIEQAVQWHIWINRWTKFSVDSFLRSTYDGIIAMANFGPGESEYKLLLEPLKELLPWPQEAFIAYLTFNYTPSLDISIVELTRDPLGHWWTDMMHSFEGGLSALPNAFEEQLNDCIIYNRYVDEVEYTYERNITARTTQVHVDVKGKFTKSGRSFSLGGDAVIITVPLNVLRGIKIHSTTSVPFPKEFQKAIEHVWYSPSTKILLQYKEKFWEGTEYNIRGGFSKTNRPIGQVHYPTSSLPIPSPPLSRSRNDRSSDDSSDVVNSGEVEDRKGILMVYTWKSEALLFGSMEKNTAINLALSQIEEIHPGSSALFETGAVQAWYSDPSTLGAFALLKPQEYYNVLFLMLFPWRNIYFAGEAVSFTHGWIQGALVSGVKAAFQFYCDNEVFNYVKN